MPCYHPITAYKAANQAKLVFSDTKSVRNKGIDVSHSLQIPCGQCIGCRLEKSRQWAMRCMHEAQLHSENCFVTLTYNEKYLPFDRSLNHRHFQLFFKRLRKKYPHKSIRFYMAGEYGSEKGRPHYHACIFGWSPSDKQYYKRTGSGSIIYTSKELDNLWSIKDKNTKKYDNIGFTSVGDVTFESAAYIARYIMDKQKGKLIMDDYGTQKWAPNDDQYITCNADGELQIKEPEYNQMSRRPGIAFEWFKKYKNDVFPNDYVVIRGQKVKPPKYYDKKLKEFDPFEYDDVVYERDKRAKLNIEDNSYERLLVKEQVVKAKLRQLKRTLT